MNSSYPYLNLILNTCSSYCVDGYFLNMTNCLQCDKSCLTCQITSLYCVSCNKSSNLYPNYNQNLNKCSLTCDDGYYLYSV